MLRKLRFQLLRVFWTRLRFWIWPWCCLLGLHVCSIKIHHRCLGILFTWPCSLVIISSSSTHPITYFKIMPIQSASLRTSLHRSMTRMILFGGERYDEVTSYSVPKVRARWIQALLCTSWNTNHSHAGAGIRRDGYRVTIAYEAANQR